MQTGLVRPALALPAAGATPRLAADKCVQARSLVAIQAGRYSTFKGRGVSRRAPEDGAPRSERRFRAREPSSGYAPDDKPAKAQLPRTVEPDVDNSAPARGVDLDELLDDNDAVDALRKSLVSSLSAQHVDSLRGEDEDGAPSSSTQPKQQQRREAGRGAPAGDDRSNRRGDRPDRTGRAKASPRTDKGDGGSEKSRPRGPSSTVLPSRDDPGRASGRGRTATDAPVVVLKKDKARLFATGNPMVYGGAVDCVIGRPPPGIGDAVLLESASGRELGWGVFNPHSMFRVRLLQLHSEMAADPRAAALRLNVPALVAARVRQAAELRRALGLPSQQTNVYRLVNSEGDRLSGLVVDVLGETLVVQALAGWVQRYRSDVEAAIRSATGLDRIVWRPLWNILVEEGLEPPSPTQRDGDAGGETEEGGRESDRTTAEDEAAALEERVEVREAGLKLLASPMGQKTGFYADQRDSRAFLASLVAGKAAAAASGGAGGGVGRQQQRQTGPTVLDLCCYSGGFALAAAAAGASRAVGVDSSEAAIALARANAELNGLAAATSFERADVSDFMRAAVEEGRSFDIVVLDPPKLAPDRNTLGRARNKYLQLNRLAMRLVRPGGLLMTCSCSGAMTQTGEFPDMVMEAAKLAGRQATLLRTAGAAPDHALNPAYPEGQYLTNLTLRLL